MGFIVINIRWLKDIRDWGEAGEHCIAWAEPSTQVTASLNAQNLFYLMSHGEQSKSLESDIRKKNILGNIIYWEDQE